jgi:peptide/nickel transport system substrate-binding protein
MLAIKRRLRSSTKIVFLLVLLTNLPIVFASTDPMDDSRVNTIIWETIALPWETIDPHRNYESAGGHVSYNVYETLFTYPWDSVDTTPSEPLLAESVDISSDGLTYTFTLHQDVTFHDGTAFNATAAQMNFWRMLGRGWDEGWGPVWMIAEPILGGQAVQDAVYEFGDGSPQHVGNWTYWKENSGAVEVTGEYELQVKLASAFTPFIPALTYSVGSMISPTFFMAHGGMSPESDDLTLHENTCGTGPYMLEEWIQDDRLTIVLNENYWRKEDGKITHPRAGSITEVTWKLNSDSNSRLLNLHAGSIDGCDLFLSNAYELWNNVSTRGDGTLQSIHPDIKVWTGLPNFNVAFLGFSMHPYLNYSGNRLQNPFTSYYLRAAVCYAFDYQAFIDIVFNGVAIPLQGPIPEGMFAHDDNLLMPELNLSEAVLHWNQAMLNGLDTILENNSYTLNIYYNEGNDLREGACLLFKQAIENIIADSTSTDPSSPLTINVICIPWAEYLYLNGEKRQLLFFFLGWMPDYADPDNYVAPFVRSTGTFPKKVGLENSTGKDGVQWDTETVDSWIDSAAAASDSATRISLYALIQGAIVEHCAYLWLSQGVEFHVERVEMNGYVFNPMHEPYFYHYFKSTPDGLPDIPIQILLVSALAMCIITIVILKKTSKG